MKRLQWISLKVMHVIFLTLQNFLQPQIKHTVTLTCSWYHHHLNHRSLWCPAHCSSLWWHSHTQPGVCPYGTAHLYVALKQKQYSKMNNVLLNVLKYFWGKAQELLGNVKETTKETEQTVLLYALSGSRSLSPERHDWLRLCLII